MFSERGRTVLLIGIFVLVGGFAFTNYFLVLLGIFLIVGSVVTSPFFQLTLPLESLQVTREIDKTNFFQGDFIHIKLTIKNTGRSRIDSIRIFDVYPDIFRLVLGKNDLVTRIDAGQAIKYSYIVQGRLRGKYTIGPTKFQIHDRLEFRFEELSADNTDEVLVYPSYQDARIMESLAAKRRMGYMFGIHRTRQKMGSEDFVGIRRFVSGDESRRIAWKAVARTGKLMVRQFETERNMRVFIILDCGDTMSAGKAENSKLEYAIRAALLLAKAAMERKDKVGLVAWSTSQETYLKPSLGEGHYYRLLDILAAIEAGGEFDLAAAVGFVAARVTQQSFFIILSDCEANRAQLEKGVRLLRGHKHNAIIIAPFGPWFEIEDVYLSPVERALGEAIVYKLLEERRTLSQSFRRIGVPIIDVSPGDILPTLLSEYLKAKKKGIAQI